MAEIRVLDKHTAELIAAGEVVERPASVAKELLENAIDAGASQITLSITRGGIAQLQIIDNGSGIETEYIDKAFIRHATSKIATAQDLDHIHTLGFRGEALASIASVARVEVLTRTQEEEYACRYRIEGGEPLGMETDARPVGTTITVNELFYNTPARMKFLKKDATEGTYVAETVLHAALSHPEISFRFLRDGKQQFVTPGDGNLRSAVYATLGREFARDLLELPADQEGVYHVSGLITPPRAGRASRGAQHFYVNGRYVKNRTMMAALENAYKGTLMQGKFPGAVLMLSLPAELVDVNVHPAKTEIRFARESDVFDAVYRAVRAALATPGSGECRFEMHPDPKSAANAAANVARLQTPPQQLAHTTGSTYQPPRERFTTMTAEEYRAMHKMTQEVTPRELPEMMQLDAKRRPVQDDPALMPHPLMGSMPPKPALHTAQEEVLDVLPDLPQEETVPTTQPGAAGEVPHSEADMNEESVPEQLGLSALPGAAAEQIAMEPEQAPPLRLVGEVFKTYIITERGSDLCLIDKHAAHERILFEQLAKDYGNVPAQLLLVPVQVNLSAAEKQAVLQNVALLADAGVEVEDFGGTTVVVRTVPADVQVDDVEDMLVELADRLQQGAADAMREKTEWVLHSIACRAAIKAGDRTNAQEMLALAQRIMDGTIPPFCPHGRPCVLKLPRKELEKQFGRLV